MKIYLLSVALLFLLTFQAHGEIYKWVDENGNVHYGEELPENVQPLNMKGNLNTLEKQSYDFLPAPRPRASAAANNRVVMYSTSWCPYCSKARKYFKSRGIAFTEYDIEKNSSAEKKYKSLGGRGVPLILVGDKQLQGFSAKRFESLYKG